MNHDNMKKIEMEILSNNEACGEEIDNEQVLIYGNLIRSVNLRNNFKFDNLFSYYTKYVNKIFNEFKYKKIIHDASDIFDLQW